MKSVSLFSGIGGFDLGFQRAGIECVAVCEIDKNAQAILRRHFPKAELFDDVRKVGIATHGRKSIDVVCGGFPCQDLSVAGKRAGLAGERSGLWFEFARIIDELEPSWVVIENVPGLLSSDKGRDFAVIIQWLAQRGYGVVWRVLDAQYFGVPQRRRRVFLVASFGSGRSAEVLFERESGAGNTKPSGEAGEVFAFYAGQGSKAGSIAYGNQSPTLKAASSGTNQVPTITPPLRASGGVTSSPTMNKNKSDLDFLVSIVEQNNFVSTPDMISLRANPAQPLIVMAHGQANAEIVRDGSPSLTANHEQPIVAFTARDYGADASDAISGSEGIRRLMPIECERLQGFPDGWTDGQSDTQRYKQLGNAVAVPVVEWIAKRIAKASQIQPQ